MNFFQRYDPKRKVWLRPGTLDTWIFDQIEKDYCLTEEDFCSEDIAIDIGAHIGFFSKKILDQKIGHVFLFEPHPGNVPLCKKNLEAYKDRITFSEKAVWDKSGVNLFFDQLSENTGHNIAHSKGSIPAVSISLDEVIKSATQCFKKRIRILKIDAEGAEWPIILNSSCLGFIDLIVGEVHEFGIKDIDIPENLVTCGCSEFSRREFQGILKSQGFSMRITQDSGSYYVSFKAINTACLREGPQGTGF